MAAPAPLRSAFALESVLLPRAEALQAELEAYGDTLRRLAEMRQQYGMERFDLPASIVLSAERAREAAAELELTLRHVAAVEQKQRSEYVLLRRESLCRGSIWGIDAGISGPAAAAARATARSPILCNKHTSRLKFVPGPCAEVLVHSPILAHSRTIRRVSAS